MIIVESFNAYNGGNIYTTLLTIADKVLDFIRTYGDRVYIERAESLLQEINITQCAARLSLRPSIVPSKYSAKQMRLSRRL